MMMKRKKTVRGALGLAVAVTAATLAVPGVSLAAPAEASVDAEAFGGQRQNISELAPSLMISNTSDNTRPGDEGHIFVGEAITDGGMDTENSNWVTGDAQNLLLNHEVTGEGFTALRAWGYGSQVNVSGTLILQDDSDGTYASDFTGTGAGITAAAGAFVNVTDMQFQSRGLGRSFAVVEDGTLIMSNSDIKVLGADPSNSAYDGGYHASQTDRMQPAPWNLGITGGARAVNVLGKTAPATVVSMDSSISAGGWAAVSTEECVTPRLYFFNTELNILPMTEGGMNSGWEILGYEEDLYGSGYGTYLAGDASESFYGTMINGATYGSVLNGGTGTYEGLKGEQTYTAADLNEQTVTEYQAAGDTPTVVNTIWGIMSHGNGTINLNEGSVWNSAEGTVLCKEADTVWNFQGAELHPGNGIIFQMMDNDAFAVSEADPGEMYMTEEAGFPADAYEGFVTYTRTEDEKIDPEKTYYQAVVYSDHHMKFDTEEKPNADTDSDVPADAEVKVITDAAEESGDYAEIKYFAVEEPTAQGLFSYFERSTGAGSVQVRFANGTYEGCVYNGTGYYEQAGDALHVTIAKDAELTGDIALTSYVHGIFLDGREVDDVIAAIEKENEANEHSIEYVLLDADGNVTDDKEKAAAVQFTRFSGAACYLLGHVINKTHYNGLAAVYVTVEGTWTPTAESLVNGLEIKEGAHVKGKITRLEDGSILIQPSEEELAPGIYGSEPNVG